MATPWLRRFRTRRACRNQSGHKAGSFERLEPRLLLSAAPDLSFSDDGVGTFDFGQFSSGNDQASAVLVQGDRTVLVGTTRANGESSISLARYAIDGSLDATFGHGGRVVSRMGSGSWFAHGAVLDADGGIIVTGTVLNVSATAATTQGVLVRFDSSGNLDSSFGTGGFILEDFGSTEVNFRSIRIDGQSLVVAGDRGLGIGLTDIVVARYGLDGARDLSFGGGDGWATAHGGQKDFGRDLAINSAGQIYVAGSIGFVASSSQSSALWRFHADGTWDQAYDADGVLQIAPALLISSNSWLDAIEVDEQDRVVAGGFRNASSINATGFVIRMDSAGAVDPTFDGDGLAFGMAEVRDLEIDGLDRIVLATYNRRVTLVRLMDSGAFDAAFGTGGIASGPGNGANSVAHDNVGQIVTGGWAWTGTDEFLLTRFTSEGQLDTSLSEDGWLTTDFTTSADETGVQTVVLPNGKLLVAGDIGETGSKDLTVARFNPNGTLDTTFGGGDGWLSINLINSDAMGGLALDSLGRIVIAATADVRFNSGRAHVLRLTPDGELDATFNGSGKLALSSSTAAHAVQIDSRGRIVISGETLFSSIDSVYMLARVLPTGVIDTTFNHQLPGSSAGPSPFEDIEILPDDSILGVGQERWAQTGMNISVRYYTVDGRSNLTGFGEPPYEGATTGAGFTIIDFAGRDDFAAAMSRDSAGRILVAGSATAADGTRQMAVARLAPDGRFDRTFGVEGRLMIPVGASAAAHDIIPMPDGSILVVGQTTSVSGEADSVIVRLSSEGQLDPAFDEDGVMVIDFGGADGLGAAVLDHELNLLVTGNAALPLTHSDLLLARFQTTTPGVNEVPVGNGESYGMVHGSVLSVTAPGVLANDADAEGDVLTAVLEAGPAHGALNFNADGSFVYTPDAGYAGGDVFTYRALDGELQSNLVTVTLNVVNHAPTLQSLSLTTPEDVPLEGVVTGVDQEGDPLTFSLVTAPTHGTVAFNVDGTFVYTPVAKFFGFDSFKFRASDGIASSALGAVNVNVTAVNEAPVAEPDSFVVPHGKLTQIPAPGFLANDHDGEGDTFFTSVVRSVAHGTLTLLSGGGFRYTSNLGFTGVDSFEYRLHDGTEFGNTTTVTLEVVNTPPVVEDRAFSINEDVGMVFLMGSYFDAENNPPTFSIVDAPTNGTAQFTSSGLLYRGAANWSGVDTLTYKASDGADDSNIATVTITVNPVNDPPTARPDLYSVIHDRPLVVPGSGVLANDSDVEGAALTAVLASQPQCGTVDLNSDGSFTYVPQAGFVGSDSFTYRAHDGSISGGLAIVTIKVTNLPPTVQTQQLETDRNVPLVGQLAIADPDGDPLQVTHTQPVNGTVEVDDTGGFVYTPRAGWWGTEVFEYQVSDGAVDSVWVSVIIKVNYVNAAAPVANPDHYQVRQGDDLQVAPIGVLANDTDADFDSLSATLIESPHFFRAFAFSGGFSYVPHASFHGTDSFTYFASDGVFHSNPTTVTIEVVEFGAPSGLTAGVSGSSVTLNWFDNGNGYTDGYVIERAAKTKGKNSTPSYQQVGIADSPTFTDSGVSSGTWLYRVKAFDGGYFSAYSSTLQVSIGGSTGGGGGGKPGKGNSKLASTQLSSGDDALLTSAMQEQWSTQTTQPTGSSTPGSDATLDLLSLVQSGLTIEVKSKEK